ncbi:MAG TPA: hypothetical protein VK186_11025 [Candidatus Deferrimicrobium sp.]|nr:hypothetical protein [Candidatus Deferrimicrobium sp.]
MDRQTENKIILIVRRTRLDELIARFNTADQARFYIEHLGADFSDYVAEDRTYKFALQETERILTKLGRLQIVDRTFVPNFLFGEKDTVVVLGQDGLVANVLKYLTTQVVMGVNPDPRRWEGVLLPFRVENLHTVVPEVFDRKRGIKEVTMAKVALNTGETLYGVNDLFIGPKTHTSARYAIRFGKRSEIQSSSGVIVSTGLGATGWFRSIITGATGIAASLTPEAKTTVPLDQQHFSWNSDYLFFSVREPWPSKTSSAGIIFGKITPDTPLNLVSQMPENGVIFSDGIESDFIKFDSGTCAAVSVAEKKGRLAM